MNEFDKRMRARARAEDCPVPEGFDGRLEGLLEELPERQAARKPRRLRRTAAPAASAARRRGSSPTPPRWGRR